MKHISPESGRLLGELLRLRLWAGDEELSAGRAFGLLHGFETAMQQEELPVISEATQDAVEDMLEDVESGKQGTDGASIKNRLHGAKVDETVAAKVMQLCLLQSRFTEGIEKIIDGRGSVFSHLRRRMDSPPWSGAMFYVELLSPGKQQAFLTPCVPRVGEIVTPRAGQSMVVSAVEYVAVPHEGRGVPILIPHVHLDEEDGGDEDEEDLGEELPETD